jgi:tRNA-specific 2-thiouridylase
MDMGSKSAQKIIVGMSGGVDSSVAAALLVKEGHRVTGVTMKIWSGGPESGGAKHGCYGPGEEQEIEDARRVARSLSIPFHVIDLAREYREEVLDYFCAEYLAGRTPNPCVRCNRRIKFGALVERAAETGLEFDFFATGHYTRREMDSGTGRVLLKKGVDSKKDQSYFLYGLTQSQLARALFPLGDYYKEQVRRMAVDFGLGLEDRKDSQNFVCGSYSSLFSEKPLPGPIVDEAGRVLGEHTGIVNYTVGQRKGLRIGTVEPLYVIDIKPETNTVVAGVKSSLYTKEQLVAGLNWISVKTLERPMEVKARIRSSHQGYDAVVSPHGNDSAKVAYMEKQIGAARGQAIVFYTGDTVVGGGATA